MSNPTIILISGKQGSGKTTLTQSLVTSLQNEGHLVQCLKFAGTIYAMHDLIRDYGRSLGLNIPDKDGRLLQLLGTEWGRSTLGENVWVDALRAQIGKSEADYILIDDCRFPNELDVVPKEQRVAIRLDAPSHVRKARCPAWRDTDKHPSEAALDGYMERFDTVINTEHNTESEVLKLALKSIWASSGEYETTRLGDGSELRWWKRKVSN